MADFRQGCTLACARPQRACHTSAFHRSLHVVQSDHKGNREIICAANTQLFERIDDNMKTE